MMMCLAALMISVVFDHACGEIIPGFRVLDVGVGVIVVGCV